MIPRLKAWAAGALAVLAGLFGIYTAGRRREREKQEAHRMAEHAEDQARHIYTVERANEARRDVDSSDDDAVRNRLRDWHRD